MLPNYTPSKFLPHEREFLASLDEYQAKYVFSPPTGVSAVVASAGSGKSHSSVGRALYLVREHGFAPKTITLLAFNNKAAAELLERWRKLSAQVAQYINTAEKEISFEDSTHSQWALPDLTISTIHSYAFGMFSRHMALMDEEKSVFRPHVRFSILSEYSSIKLYKKVAKELYPAGYESDQKSVIAFYYHIENLAAKNLIYPLLAYRRDLKGAPRLDNPQTSTITDILSVFVKPDKLDSPLINHLPNPLALQAGLPMYQGVLDGTWKLEHEYSPDLGERAFKEALKELGEFKGWTNEIPSNNLRTALQLNIIREFYLMKYQSRSLSFSDMIFLPTLLTMQVPSLRDSFSSVFSRSVIADESQDLDSLQFTLLYSLWSDSFAMVGDARQWLYGFRAANFQFLENLQQISEAYEPLNRRKRPTEFQRFSIQKNYRCPPTIVELSNRAASTFEDMVFMEAVAAKASTPRTLVIREYDTPQAEMAEISQTIKQLKAEGVELHDIMVLSRTNRVLAQLEPHMIRHGLPYRMRLDSRSIIRQGAYQWITSIYSIIANPNDITAILEVFENIKGFGAAYLQNLQYELDDPQYLYYESKDKVPVLTKVLAKVGNSKQRLLAKYILDNFLSPLLSVYSQILGRGKGVPDVNNFISNLAQANFNLAPDRPRGGPQQDKDEPPKEEPPAKPNQPFMEMDLFSLNRILTFTESIYWTVKNVQSEDMASTHIEETASGSFLDSILESRETTPVGPTSTTLAQEASLEKSELVCFQEVYSALFQSFNEDVEEDVGPDGKVQPVKKGRNHKGKVLLSTIHSAKGGQADYVLYCGLALFNPVSQEDWTAEQACSYVAITRAKERLYVSHSALIEDFNGQPRKGTRNPFFEEILSNVQDMARIRQQQAESSTS